MSNVNVTSNPDKTWWRMEYGGQVDYVEEEPNDAQKAAFIRSVIAQRNRERVESELPRPPEGYQGSEVTRA